jgi:hypothetical protein
MLRSNLECIPIQIGIVIPIWNSDLDGGYDFKVKMWFLNPTKYFKEIEMEQNHHPGKCIYHLSKSYLTCNVQKECLKLLAT